MACYVCGLLLTLVMCASASRSQGGGSDLAEVPIFGPTWDPASEKWVISLGDDPKGLDAESTYSMVVFAVTLDGEQKVATCAGVQRGVGCKASFDADIVGQELRLQLSANGADGFETASQHAFAWDPQRCLLQGELQFFSKPEQSCKYHRPEGSDGKPIELSELGALSKGLAGWPAFGVELELIAREDPKLYRDVVASYAKMIIAKLQVAKEKNLETARKYDQQAEASTDADEAEKFRKRARNQRKWAARKDEQIKAPVTPLPEASVWDAAYKDARKARVDAVTACWDKAKGDEAKLRGWSIHDDWSVVSVNEFSVHSNQPIVEPEVQKVYQEKAPASELDGIGVEVVTPVISGESGADDLTRGLSALASMGVQANPSGGLHVHMNAMDAELGETLNLQQYVSVLLGWVESQVAINRMHPCTRLAKPYAVFLYADQAPVKDWFPGLHQAASDGRIEAASGGSSNQKFALLRELLNPELATLAAETGLGAKLFSGQEVVINTHADAFKALQKRLGWRTSYYEIGWRATFNYDSTAGLLTKRGDACSSNSSGWFCPFYWSKVHGSIEFRQHAGTYEIKDALRWVQFLSAFIHHYKQPSQVERIFTSYLSGNLNKARQKLIAAQRSRTLKALLHDLNEYVEADSQEFFSEGGCKCIAGEVQQVDAIQYNPMNHNAFSIAQTSSLPPQAWVAADEAVDAADTAAPVELIVHHSGRQGHGKLPSSSGSSPSTCLAAGEESKPTEQ